MHRSGVALSAEAERRLVVVFPDAEEQDYARRNLVELCGAALPGTSGDDPARLDRVRFSILKLSEGSLDKFDRAVSFARTDWRDLFVAAGFAHDPRDHETWEPR